jgi:hypothetical protein
LYFRRADENIVQRRSFGKRNNTYTYDFLDVLPSICHQNVIKFHTRRFDFPALLHKLSLLKMQRCACASQALPGRERTLKLRTDRL